MRLDKNLNNYEKIKQGDVAYLYLKKRGIDFKTYKDLKNLFYCPNITYKDSETGFYFKYKGIIACFNDGKSIHRTYLIPQENDNYKTEKKMLGKSKGSFIEFFLENESLETVCIAEGIETALSVRQITGLPVYCAATANNMEKFTPVDCTKEVFICADKDKTATGTISSNKLKEKLSKKSISCLVLEAPLIRPNAKSNDWNDVLMEKGDDEALEYYKSILDKEKAFAEKYSKGEKVQSNPSAFEVASLIIEKIKDIYCDENALIYQKGKWFKRDNTNTFILIKESELRFTITSFLQDNNIFPQKITDNLIKNVILNLKPMLEKPDLDFPYIQGHDVDPRYTIFCKHQVLDISSEIKEINIENQKDVITDFRLPIHYVSGVKTPSFNKFLTDISSGNQGFIDVLQEFFGFCLTNHYDFHKFLFIYGQGRNGKGVIETILRALFGDKSISNLAIEDISDKFRPAQLLQKSINISSEGSFRKPLNESLFKDLTSGGSVTVENKYEAPFDMKNTAKFIIMSNEMLKLNDKSDAAWARCLVLPIDFQILDTKQQNSNLSDVDWWLRSGELPGILDWAIRGRQRLYKNKQFTVYKKSEKFLDQCKRSSDFIREFLLDHYEYNENGRLSTSDMFEEFKAYSEKGNYSKTNMTVFSQQVGRVFPKAKKKILSISSKKRVRGWLGIAHKI